MLGWPILHRWLRRRIGPAPDSGFTLVESIVALVIAGVVFTAFAYATVTSVVAARTSRLDQQATDVLNQQIEAMRALSYDNLAHDPTDMSSDTNMVTCGTQKCYVTTAGSEPLATNNGTLKPHVSTTTINNQTFTTKTYITQPTDAFGGQMKRVTVVVTYQNGSQTLTKTASTMVSKMQRGLASLQFKLSPVGPTTITVAPTATAAFGVQLNNIAAQDSWNITTNLSGATIYLDNGDGYWDAGTDTTTMIDHNGDGIRDTGFIDTNQALLFWVVRTVPAGTANGYIDFDVTAKSISRGTDATGTAILREVIKVDSNLIRPQPTGATATPTATYCPATPAAPTPSSTNGYTRWLLTLRNSGSDVWPDLPLPSTGPIPGSTALYPMSAVFEWPAIPGNRGLPELSTNLEPDDTAGRLLYPGGSVSTNTPSQVADFQYTESSGRGYAGSFVVRFWAQPLAGSTSLNLRVQPYKQPLAGGTITPLGSEQTITIPSFTCSAGFREVWAQINLTSPVSVSKSEILGFRVWNAGADKAVLAYDHELFPASVALAEK